MKKICIYLLLLVSYNSFAQSNYNFILVSHPTGPLPWQEMTIKENYLYLAASYYSFYIYDASPLNPQQIGSINLNYWPLEIDIYGNHAYVANSDSGLKIIDITSPASPTIAGKYNSSGACGQVCMYQYYAYTDMSGYPIINCNNPSSPQVIGNLNITNPIKDMFIEGNKLYVAESGIGIKIFDLTNPSNPNLLGTDNFSGVDCIHVINDTVYGGYGFWLRVVDASIASSPSEVGLFNTGHNIKDVHISNEKAFILNDDRAVRAIDIQNIQSMSETGYYQYTNQHLAHDIFSVGDYVYIAHGDVGGIIIRYQQTSEIEENFNLINNFKLNQNYPNPFNMETNISFYLPKQKYTELKIYDINGRHVNTLISGELREGEHEVVWNGQNSSGQEVSSGIYTYHLKTEDYSQILKLLLLK